MKDLPFPPRSFEELVQLLQSLTALFTLAEIALALVLVLLALLAPRLGTSAFAAIERRFAGLARHPARQIAMVGLLAIVARALMLPWLGIPEPYVFDEQSIVLQGQTFAAGRLANPTHPFWQHFETYYVNHLPAYASMYFPGRGAPLALGLLIAGNAWIGVWMSVVLMCMVATWMLQGWVSLPMALLGGILVTLRLGVFSYWVNTYWGGAFVALGAMLVMGAMPRILRAPSWWQGAIIGLGAAILMTTRPYEGALLCLPVAIVILARLLRAGRPAFLKVAIPATVLVGAAGALMLAHNSATTGDPLETPYSLNREVYSDVPPFLVAAPVESQNRGPAHFRTFFAKEGYPYLHRDSPRQIARMAAGKLLHTWNFYIGAIFTFAFLAGLGTLRRDRVLLATLVFFLLGYSIETWNFPHYTAPLYPVLLILMMRGFERLRSWRLRGRPAGLFLTRAMPTAAIALLALPVSSVVWGVPSKPESAIQESCCSINYSRLRTEVIAQLTAAPGPHLVLVRDGPQNPMHAELVYNPPDIDHAEVVWARRLSPEQDQDLQRYFADRRVWEFEWRPETKQGYTLRQIRPPAEGSSGQSASRPGNGEVIK